MAVEERAWAKINLTLDVTGKRSDGYHDMAMVMETVELCDILRFSHEGQGLQVKSDLSFLPEDDGNLAAIAARQFEKATGRAVEPLTIEIEKHIPVCAGTAGGSSDAAAVLRYLDRTLGTMLSRERLEEIGASIGSDVPYCVAGGTALAQGRGERLTALPRLPRCGFVLCKPAFSISTPALFAQLDRCRITRRPDTQGVRQALEAGDLAGVARRLYNVFEDVLLPRQKRVVDEIKHTLIDSGALGAAMTGTGPTVFGLFDDDDRALEASTRLRESYPDTFFCHNV